MILNRHLQLVNIARIIADMMLVAVSWSIAFSLRFDSGLVDLPKGGDSFLNYARLYPTLALSYFIVFIGTGVYSRSLSRRKVWDENFDLLRAHAISFVVFVSFSFFLFEHKYSRITMAIFFGIVTVILPLGRSLVRKTNRFYLSSNEGFLSTVLVGEGALFNSLQNKLSQPNEWNLKILEFLDSNSSQRLREILESGTAQLVIFVGKIPQQLDGLDNTLTEIMLLPDLGLPTLLSPKVESFGGLPAISLNSSPLDGYGKIQKRCFDILFAATFLIVFMPVYFICALCVWLSSKGPILYKQERMGLDGKTFQCLKFRGMRADAEATTGPVWASQHDDRVTPVGKWLRRTSLDEIPQFWNVLMGEMSVVGPRPERPIFVQDFRTSIPGYMLRHKVKAGITGWAQINGWRGNTSLEQRISCDLWYLQNWTVWLDLKICLLTPIKGFIHPNAY
jgi:Undecaprenyl-phosphate glucose phosphotransferase